MFLFTQQYWNEEHDDLFWAAVGSFVVVNIIATVLILCIRPITSDCLYGCLSFFPLLIFVFAGNFLLPIGKPFLQMDMQNENNYYQNESFCASFEKTVLFQPNSA